MRKSSSGFTTLELLITLAVLGILVAIAVPSFVNEIPRYRLKKAANELYANMQQTKMGAIKENRTWAVVFDPANLEYKIWSYGENDLWENGENDNVDNGVKDDVLKKSVSLADYKSGVDYGHGGLVTALGGSFGTDNVTFSGNTAEFQPNGFLKPTNGYVYLQNNKGDVFGVGCPTMGVIRLSEWRNGAWQ